MAPPLSPQQQSRSRCCRRRQTVSASKPQLKFPELPLVLAGAIGGPFAIFLATPLRNAMTLGCHDVGSSFLELCLKPFRGGFANGWTGGLEPVLPSCPQFCILGPFFHFMKEATNNELLAVIAVGLAETLLCYGSATRNAQMAYNQEQVMSGSDMLIDVIPPLTLFGPGFTVDFVRNVVSMYGFRVFSSHCKTGLTGLAKRFDWQVSVGTLAFLGEFLGALVSGICSFPLHQTFNLAITSPSLGPGDYVRVLLDGYVVRGAEGQLAGINGRLLRDAALRSLYVASVFSLFGAMERMSVRTAAQVRARKAGLAKKGDEKKLNELCPRAMGA
eukprot:TRINITY_DN23271_c0_g1_i3.p1 TRINITY_DN23271_c0_g1~~TRINITY_DN23271_c0_g1_i3.p1  ORF type:complete len:351 (-),score=42.97 TRINITY_DN23271_c0_g1_i3:211-1200(-)